MRDIRDLFDVVIVEFTETWNRLCTNASIILCPLFESAIVQVQQGNSSATSTDAKRNSSLIIIIPLEKKTDDGDDISLSFVETALKRHKKSEQSKNLIYKEIGFLLSTSNVANACFLKLVIR